MTSSFSRRGHGVSAALDEIDDQHGVHRGLDRDAAGLALALPAMAVPEREEGAVDVHAEVAGRAGPHLGRVHVAAVRVGHERRARLAAGRRHADGPVHRVEREVGREVAGPGLEVDEAVRAVDVVAPHELRERILQGDGPRRGRQRPEQRERRRDGPVPRRLDRDEVEREGVARFGALDVERARLRVEGGDLLRGQVGHALDETGEAVVGPHLEDVAGLDLHHGFDPAEGPRVVAAFGSKAHDVQAGHDASLVRDRCADRRPARAGRARSGWELVRPRDGRRPRTAGTTPAPAPHGRR